jgi:hypothetical protein
MLDPANRNMTLWVIGRHRRRTAECSLYPPKADITETVGMSVECQEPTYAAQQPIGPIARALSLGFAEIAHVSCEIREYRMI